MYKKIKSDMIQKQRSALLASTVADSALDKKKFRLNYNSNPQKFTSACLFPCCFTCIIVTSLQHFFFFFSLSNLAADCQINTKLLSVCIFQILIWLLPWKRVMSDGRKVDFCRLLQGCWEGLRYREIANYVQYII